MKPFVCAFLKDEQGQDLIEYALLAGFISLAVVTMVENIGKGLNTVYSKVNAQVAKAAS